MFELILGNIVFGTVQQRTQARSIIERFSSRGVYGESGFTMLDIGAGKYGAGPSLSIVFRFLLRADADEAMADIKANTATMIAGTNIIQTSVVEGSGNLLIDSLNI